MQYVLAGPAASRDAYIAYVMPGILLFTVVGTGQGIAISVAMDMNAGIIARFRTMAIARGACSASAGEPCAFTTPARGRAREGDRKSVV